MKHKLEFLNPQFHRGYNVTVRLGGKWIDKANSGDTVEIRRTGDDNPIAIGKITDLRFCYFGEVSLQDLLEEHDRECGTPFGLVYAMLRAYPDFKLDSMVTVVRFYID